MKTLLSKLLVPPLLIILFFVSLAGHAQDGDYRLDRGDRISILVFDEPDLTLEAEVGASGIINYSYLGDIRIAGRTTQELEQTLTDRLRDGFLVNPSVNVTVIEYRPFYINGEVRAPGSYPFEQGLTTEKAIALAGGLTDRASTRKMYVLRNADSPDASGKQEKLNMSAKIFPGDIVTIKEGFF
ncbi:MAG: polysaccharide biosynthesis/export family protein [Granulosicoccus sp.]